jgi:hypothetical protein
MLFFGAKFELNYNVFGYGVGSRIVVGIVKSLVGSKE